ncbi:hypothetical protein ACFSW8_00505 [Rubritalea tangerina]|uniref:Type II secretion system protein GspG C-terminal domain-containing protein n=2 Tax=Rubritalea tangerina TaxID=430798 RepID=A0ABW4Z664_9BACT
MPIQTVLAASLRSPHTRKLWWWVVAAAPAIVLFDYLAVSPIGSDVFLWFKMIFVFGCFAALLGVVVLPFFLIFKKWRKATVAWLLLSVCFLAASLVGFVVGNNVRKMAFEGLAERSMVLVEAVHSYEETKGYPPESLVDLVPEYIDAVPSTGMMAYPEYRYSVGEDAKYFSGNPWVLRVPAPSGGINFDEFLYFPLQNYPASGYGGQLVKVGKWAYSRE